MDLSRRKPQGWWEDTAGKNTITKPEELYLNTRTHTVEEENSHNVSSDLYIYKHSVEKENLRPAWAIVGDHVSNNFSNDQ